MSKTCSSCSQILCAHRKGYPCYSPEIHSLHRQITLNVEVWQNTFRSLHPSHILIAETFSSQALTNLGSLLSIQNVTANLSLWMPCHSLCVCPLASPFCYTTKFSFLRFILFHFISFHFPVHSILTISSHSLFRNGLQTWTGEQSWSSLPTCR